MEFQNNALLAKLGWKILTNQNLLWIQALRAKYLRHGTFLETPSNPTSSSIWKGILKNREVVEKGACWAISSGHTSQDSNLPLTPIFKTLLTSNFQTL